MEGYAAGSARTRGISLRAWAPAALAILAITASFAVVTTPKADEPAPAVDTSNDDVRDRLADSLEEIKRVAQEGRNEEALSLARIVAAEARQHGLDEVHVRARTGEGGALMDLARYRESAAVLEDVFFEATRIGEDELASQVAFQLVHVVTFGLGEPEQAMEWDRHAVAAMRRAGLDPYASERLWASRGTVYEAMGRNEAALKAYRMVLRLDKDTGPDSYRDQTHTDIANVLSKLGRLDRAAMHYERSVEMSTELRGPHHPFTVRARVNLASSFAERELWDDAEGELNEILQILRDHEVSEHALLEATALNILGVVYSTRGDVEEALEAFERALPLEEELYGSDHVQISSTLTNISTAAAKLKRCDEAREHALRALAIGERNGGAGSAHAAHLSVNVAAAYRCDQRYEDALAHDRRAASDYARIQPDSEEASEAWDRVAFDLEQLGRGEEASVVRQRPNRRSASDRP